MDGPSILHIVDNDPRSRAAQARIGFALGHHVEVYADLDELLAHAPANGVVFLRDGSGLESFESCARRLGEARIGLALVGTDENPQVRAVVAAMRAGALDYLRLPMDEERLRNTIERTRGEAAALAEARRRMIEARGRIGNLSNRERQVLDQLTEGLSNKEIARILQISPRTVEIHRANMMSKLEARHPAEVVRLKFEASL